MTRMQTSWESWLQHQRAVCIDIWYYLIIFAGSCINICRMLVPSKTFKSAWRIWRGKVASDVFSGVTVSHRAHTVKCQECMASFCPSMTGRCIGSRTWSLWHVWHSQTFSKCFPNFSVQSGLQSQFDKFDKFDGICQVLSGLDGDALNEERSTESTATLLRSPQKPCSPGKTVGAEEFMPKLGNTFEQKARWMKFLAFPVWWYLFECLISMWHRLCLSYDTSTSVQYTIIYIWYTNIYIYSHSRYPPGIYNRL